MLVISIIISFLVSMVLTAYVFREISRLFGNIVETKTPFQPMTTKRIKSMGVAMFVFAGIQAVISVFISYGAAEIFSSEGFLTDHVTIKWSIIGFGILLLALAEIFDYGSSLQQDSTSIV